LEIATGLTMAVVLQGDCRHLLDTQTLKDNGLEGKVALTFLDPPFNQKKWYKFAGDDMPEGHYWAWMKDICERVRLLTLDGGALYFMQREKNAEKVLNCLRGTGWALQSLIIWTKKTSAVPNRFRFGKQYQIIAFATNGKRPRVFNRLRIDPPLPPKYKNPREHGLFVTDVWDDIRELTSGYFAGDEALRISKGERAHKQQSPVALLLRIILSSTHPGDLVLDPFAGTGTTLVVADQLDRVSVGIEIDPKNAGVIRDRLGAARESDSVAPLRDYYRHTDRLLDIWPGERTMPQASAHATRID
jgi:site-specific DNA-methyltransferase (adenine-specific)